MSAQRCLDLIRGRATASPPPHSPSKTGVNALSPGEGQGGGMQRTPSSMASPSPTLPRKRGRERAGANGDGGESQ
jgi:hypothetical protein